MASDYPEESIITGSIEEKPRRGVYRGNLVFAYAIGLCPALAVTGRVVDGLSMGAVVLAALLVASLAGSAVRSFVPSRLKLALHLLILSGVVTAIQALGRAYFSAEAARLGIYLPLVAVNCAVLGQLQEVSDRTTIGRSVVDALIVGVGFLLALTAISLVREVLGRGTITLVSFGGFSGKIVLPGYSNEPIRFFAYPAGALLVVGYLKGLQNWLSVRRGGGKG